MRDEGEKVKKVEKMISEFNESIASSKTRSHRDPNICSSHRRCSVLDVNGVNIRICARYYRAHLVTWTSVNRSCISLVTQHVMWHITNKHCDEANEGKTLYVPWYSTRIFERVKLGRKGGTEVVYAIDVAYRFRGRGKGGGVDPSSEYCLNIS